MVGSESRARGGVAVPDSHRGQIWIYLTLVNNLPRYAWELDTGIGWSAALQPIPVSNNSHSGADYLHVVPEFGVPRCLQAGPIQF